MYLRYDLISAYYTINTSATMILNKAIYTTISFFEPDHMRIRHVSQTPLNMLYVAL